MLPDRTYKFFYRMGIIAAITGCMICGKPARFCDDHMAPRYECPDHSTAPEYYDDGLLDFVYHYAQAKKSIRNWQEEAYERIVEHFMEDSYGPYKRECTNRG